MVQKQNEQLLNGELIFRAFLNKLKALHNCYFVLQYYQQC